MLTERQQILLKKALTYANGYRELKMYAHALQELDTLGETYSQEKAHLQMRLAVLMEAGSWKQALPVANILASSDSSDPGNLVNLAYVTRRAGGIEGARIILENAAKRFPKEAIIQYNLGCYACCGGQLEDAKAHLLTSFSLDASYLKLSKTDADLTELKQWLGNIAKPQKT